MIQYNEVLEIDGITTFIYDEVSSTMDIALDYIKIIDYEFIVSAAMQIKGVGRDLKQWYSPKGNLYLSIVKKLRRDVKHTVTSLSLVASIAVGDVIQELSNYNVSYKWPNDVMIDNKKIAGILLKNLDSSIVFGIGINVSHAPQNAAMLELDIKQLDYVRKSVIIAFNKRYNEWLLYGFTFLRDLWMQKAIGLNNMVHIANHSESIGYFIGVDECGAMLVKKDGIVNRYLSADKVRFSF